MRISVIFLVAAAVFFWVLAPAVADATHGGFHIVQCGTSENPRFCELCDIFAIVQNVLNFFMFRFAPPLAALMLAIGGLLMVIPPYSPAQQTKGKKIITNTVMGLAIVFFSWLAIDTIIKVGAGTLGTGGPAQITKLGPWNKIQCQELVPLPKSTASPLPLGPDPLGEGFLVQKPSPGSTQSSSCPTCVNLSVRKSTNTCANQAGGQICLVDGTLNNRLLELDGLMSSEKGSNFWRVTEAWPPVYKTHVNPCHNIGTCIDANLLGPSRGNAQDIKYFLDKAQRANLKAVYEVSAESRRQELIKAGIPSDRVITAAVTGEHFSVYLQ